MGLEDEVAQNRRDIRTQGSFFREPADEITTTERLDTVPIDVSVSGTVETREYGDVVVADGPTDDQAALARLGPGTTTFSSTADITGEFTRDGRRAFVEALGGLAVGLEQAALGSDTVAPSEADTALGASEGVVRAHGEDAGVTTLRLRSRLGARPTPATLGEAAAHNQSGRLLARLTPSSSVSLAADEEARLTVDFTLSPDTDSEAAVTDIATLSEAPRTEAATTTVDEVAVGTDSAAPSSSDTALGNRVATKSAAAEGGRDTLALAATLFRPEPTTQPHDIVEAGIRDGGTLLTRLTFPTVEKDDRLRVRFVLPLQFR